ncbi:hypothetical protein GpartN1_g2174.t1 [Galdieria partita]|uniref:Nucleoplasmin-like domain-containing protein n=1 Tax=Galdieria partita TaxID=83374 RepID=A0A9C7PTA5_9RHOD|nr:hypothetical protein GpartN1_g2174.t1 [Galdieria partita]
MDWYVLQLNDSSPQWFEASEEFPILLTGASLVEYSSQTDKRVVVSMSPVKEATVVTREVPLCVLLPGKCESIPLQHLITAPNKVTLKKGKGAKVEISGIAIVGKLS